MNGTLVNFNLGYLGSSKFNPKVSDNSNKLGYTTQDMGNYVRFIDRNGLTYVVSRNNITSSMVGTAIVYTVIGPFFMDTQYTSHDRLCLAKFLSMPQFHS